MSASPDDVRRLERVWSWRYVDPAAFADGLAIVPHSPERLVLEAFLAWREQRLDEALTMVSQILETPHLAWGWRSRARGVQGVVLVELGLVEEGVAAHREQCRLAEEEDDTVGLARGLTNLGNAFEFASPDQSRHFYLEAIELARTFREEHTPSASTESMAMEALAISNLHDVQLRHGIRLAPEIPGLATAEELARKGWPELGHHIRAVRVRTRRELGETAGALELARDLPDPASMRDVTNAISVVRTRAVISGVQGHPEGGCALIDAVLPRVSLPFQIELLDDLVGLRESAGDLRGALEASRRLSEAILTCHASQARTAVLALEVWHRTRDAEELARQATKRADGLRAAMADLRRNHEQVREMTTRDVLTGLHNRLHLWDVGEQMTATPPDQPAAQVALADLDGFKAVNDSRGHATGDAVLRQFAAALRAAARPEDLCARYGGDEFVVVRPAGVGGSLADDLESLTRLGAVRDGEPVRASIGVTTVRDGDFQHGLDRADQLMYLAKQRGGAQVAREPGT